MALRITPTNIAERWADAVKKYRDLFGAGVVQTPQGHRRRLKPLILCPFCRPATIAYSGVVILVTCRECREHFERDAG